MKVTIKSPSPRLQMKDVPNHTLVVKDKNPSEGDVFVVYDNEAYWATTAWGEQGTQKNPSFFFTPETWVRIIGTLEFTND